MPHPPNLDVLRLVDLEAQHHGITAYYGAGGGAFTVTAVLTDPLAGLGVVTFPTTVEAGQVYALNGANTAVQPHRYDFLETANFSDTATISATDRALNEAVQPFTVIHDTLPPALTVTVPPTVPVRFSVTWSDLDNAAGLRNYQVRYKMGEMGAWQDWLTDTVETSTAFIGTPDAQYYFEVTATDNVNNSTVEQVGPITVKSVTKYYTHGGTRVAMRRGDYNELRNGTDWGEGVALLRK